MAILTINQKIEQVNNFINSVEDKKNSYYCFVGRAKPWEDAEGNVDEANVLQANDSISQVEQTVYRDIVYGKRVEPSDITFMLKRYNWEENTVYARYNNNDPNLYSKNFYVITETNDVYKCIDNGYSPASPNGVPSTVKPSINQTTGSFATYDGYIWKYMFTCDTADYLKFSTTNYFPVNPNTEVIDNAVPGTIDALVIIDGGSNFQVYETGFLDKFVNNYVVQLPTTSSPYNNHYAGSSMYLKAGFGAGQIRFIKSYSGVNKTLSVDPPFNYYENLKFSEYFGDFVIGDLVYQVIDNLTYIYKQGYFNNGDSLIQSDTGATGVIRQSNSSVFKVQNYFEPDFHINYPVYNTSESAIKKLGKADVDITTNPNKIYGNIATSFSADYEVGSYIRVGENANNNIRRVTRISNATPYDITANTIGFDSVNDVIKIPFASLKFQVNDRIYYDVPSGNTAIAPLTGDSYYYVSFVNSSSIALSSSYNGSNINITDTRTSDPAETHTISNEEAIFVNYPYFANVNYANNYLVPTAFTIDSYSSHTAEGAIVYINLNSAELNISETFPSEQKFILGETVAVVDSANNNQFSNGIVSFSNATNLIISNVNGVNFIPDLYVYGLTSHTKSKIDLNNSSPNITVETVLGGFVSGAGITSKTPQGISVANGFVISKYASPNDLTEYLIGPTVNINGDGNGALAYCTVDLSGQNSGRALTTITLINNGQNYTRANVTITDNFAANNSIEKGAVIEALISSVKGHGSEPINELGAIYAGVSKKFDTGINEDFYLPIYNSYRSIGILKNPYIKEAAFDVNEFDRSTIEVANTNSINFVVNEIVVQPTSNAAGIVVSYNDSILEIKNTKGTFLTDGVNLGNTDTLIYGWVSGAYAHATAANTKYFSLVADLEAITDKNTAGSARITNATDPGQISVTNILGSFTIGDSIYEPSTNAYATISNIYTSNGATEPGNLFGVHFDQTARISLSSNNKSYSKYEYVYQENTFATGRIISTSDEIDLIYSSEATFIEGDTIYNDTTGAEGIVSFSDSTNQTLSLSAITKTGFNETYNRAFNVGDTIRNFSNTENSTINSINSVLILDDVGFITSNETTPYSGQFQVGSNKIIGYDSGAEGTSLVQGSILYPDLVKNSGKVIYLENISKFDKTPTSTEQLKLIIKF
jgi:hypothetical protein